MTPFIVVLACMMTYGQEMRAERVTKTTVASSRLRYLLACARLLLFYNLLHNLSLLDEESPENPRLNTVTTS